MRKICDICFSESDIFLNMMVFSSMCLFLQMTWFHSLQLNNTLLCMYTTFSFSSNKKLWFFKKSIQNVKKREAIYFCNYKMVFRSQKGCLRINYIREYWEGGDSRLQVANTCCTLTTRLGFSCCFPGKDSQWLLKTVPGHGHLKTHAECVNYTEPYSTGWRNKLT